LNNVDSGAQLTDELIYEAISKFPAGQAPDLIIMSREAQNQLRNSRTTYNPAGIPAATPDVSAGIQILVSDAVKTDEALIA
jgi:hypothetical protein